MVEGKPTLMSGYDIAECLVREIRILRDENERLRYEIERLQPRPIVRMAQRMALVRQAKRTYPNPHAKVERNAEILRMHHDGQSHGQIADAHGITRTRAAQIIWKEEKKARQE